MEQLSPTAYVILGMIRGAPRSGYEIKAVVDETTRFFWAASYGQIYPELKRLSEAGLVAGVDTPPAGRKRTTYEITADGGEALKAARRRASSCARCATTAARCISNWSPWSRARRPSRTRSR